MNDIIADGLAGGWQVSRAGDYADNSVIEVDVAIIGTGAGGATSAEILSASGLNVLMIEEGKFRYQKDFKLDELDAFSGMYQEGTGRKTADGAISIYQGRTVGGSTTVNWTSTFRTPENTLKHWQSEFGLKGFSADDMAPWFANREKALSMSPWLVPPNGNNSVLKRGCEALGFSAKTMVRNVKGCWNLGYCGFGCPTNAKQSMLVTSIPSALNKKAQLLSNARVERFRIVGDNVEELICTALDAESNLSLPKQITVRAKHFVLSAGAIGSPGVLLRSKAPDPYKTLGKRTFLHPVNLCLATMKENIKGFEGAPQSVYSNEFLWKDGITGPAGYKLEVAPIFPGGLAAQDARYGKRLSTRMKGIVNTSSMIALMRDGFHEESQGGVVKLRDDGSPVLDYEITDYLWEGFRRAYLSMAEIQFAAGAKSVSVVHHDAEDMQSWAEAKRKIAELPLAPLRAALFSAHVMGGCGMGENPKESVVNSLGEHHQLRNLNVIDGSCFPTSIGANPQLSIYGLAAMQATQLAKRLV